MNFEMVVTAVLVGAIAGWVAGRVMKDGRYGLSGDMSLGLVGTRREHRRDHAIQLNLDNGRK